VRLSATFEAGHTPSAWALTLLVFVPFSSGYFLSFLFRSINAVIAPDLVRDVGVGASGLGFLTAAFFFGFALVQLPLGILLDRYGAARVQAALLVVAGAGSLLFALADSPTTLVLARALIGLGCAGGLMAAFKSIVKWYPPERLTFVNGCYLAVGGLGAIMATAPVEAALSVTGWRTLFMALALLSLASAALVFFLVPRGDAAADPPPLRTQVRELAHILRDRLFWRFIPISVMGMGGTLAIQGLWAGPWLIDGVGLDRGAAASRLLALSTAMTVGFVVTGLVADRLRARGISSLLTMAGGTAVSVLALAAITFGVDAAGWWHWIVLGLFGQVSAIVYPTLSRHFGPAYAGRAGTGNTLLVFAGIFALQFGMGAIIDLWPRDATGAYPAQAYQAAFGAVLAGLVASVAWLLRPGEDRRQALAKVV
jgi:predicted MFS family arabinose efflux permease